MCRAEVLTIALSEEKKEKQQIDLMKKEVGSTDYFYYFRCVTSIDIG